MRLSAFMATCIGSLALTACTASSDIDSSELGQADAEIVGGAADTTHPAVVAWIHGSKCSATIIHRVGGTGYALTAAHCVGGALGNILEGPNHSSPDRTYPVTAQAVHPGYADSDAFDVAVLTFSGADAATPVLPVATKSQDNLVVGSNVDAIGYGLMPGANTVRRIVQLGVVFESEMLLGFNQSANGICSGDSGGASLASERVVGVHSFVTDSNCTGANVRGFDVRAAAVLEPFINTVTLGANPTLHTCDECSDAHINLGLCRSSAQACTDTASCGQWIDCRNACSTQPCRVACDLDNAAGKAIFDGIADCVCDTACTAECAGDAYCDEPPMCYLTSSNASCQSCFETSCCDEVSECAADASCVACVTTSDPPASCANVPTVQAFDACIAQNCDAECPDNGGLGGGGGVMNGAGGAGGGGGEVSGGFGGTSGGAGGVTVSVGGAAGGTAMANDDDGDQVIESGCGGCYVGKQRPSRLSLAAFGLALMLGARRRRSREGD